jgi:hypothetical protein
MADNQDNLVLVAKLTDQVGDKLKEIQKNMLATMSAAKKMHEGSGEAALRIDLNGFPRGTRTAASASGMFKEVNLRRCRSMPLASEGCVEPNNRRNPKCSTTSSRLASPLIRESRARSSSVTAAGPAVLP